MRYSVITRSELLAGSTGSDLVSQLLAPLREIAVDRPVAERAGRVARECSIRLPDALTAATAREHGLSLVTKNRKDFDKVRGL
jgi:predicted nucleic acid-binding protein